MTERALHIAVAAYLDAVLGDGVVYTTIGHGGGGKARGGQLKAMGMKPGVPDIALWHAGKCFMIELKSAKGGVSKVQVIMHNRLRIAGVTVETARSVDDVQWWLGCWDIPMRGRVAA